MDRKIARLEGKVADQWALCMLSVAFTGMALTTTFFFLQKAASSEWNAVQTALTVFEVFLVVALAVGFWTVRRAAMDRAEDVAREVARECSEAEVKEYVRLFVTPKLVREIIEGSEDLGGGANLTEQTVHDMMDKLT